MDVIDRESPLQPGSVAHSTSGKPRGPFYHWAETPVPAKTGGSATTVNPDDRPRECPSVQVTVAHKKSTLRVSAGARAGSCTHDCPDT